MSNKIKFCPYGYSIKLDGVTYKIKTSQLEVTIPDKSIRGVFSIMHQGNELLTSRFVVKMDESFMKYLSNISRNTRPRDRINLDAIEVWICLCNVYLYCKESLAIQIGKIRREGSEKINCKEKCYA